MLKSGIDQDAIIAMIGEASSKQGAALRKAVGDATLKALQGRELTLANIRSVLKAVTQAAAKGAEKSGLPTVDLENMLGQAISGIDTALLQTVEANRRALQQFVGQGVELRETRLKSALADLRRIEDVFISTLTKAAQSLPEPVQGPWTAAISALQAKGTDTGTRAASTVEQLMTQAQTAVREGQALGGRTAQALLDGYTALVSGVLLGMAEGLQGRQPGSGPDDAAGDGGSSSAAVVPAKAARKNGRPG